jgi:3-dehydroquinate dehydratase-1
LKKIGPVVKAAGKLLVVSFHDFVTTPNLTELEKIVRHAKKEGAEIVKIATNTTTQDRLRTLAALMSANSKELNLIVIGMGGFGLVTRLLFPALGSLIIFASVADQHTAPGQLPYLEMFDLRGGPTS